MAIDTDAQALFDALFREAPVGLGLWDADLRYRRVNPALARMNGVAPGDHLGRTPREVLGVLGVEVEGVLRRVVGDGVAILDVDRRGRRAHLPDPPHAARGVAADARPGREPEAAQRGAVVAGRSGGPLLHRAHDPRAARAHGADVALATGGHLAPLVARAGGGLERLDVRGPIVGALRAPRFGEQHVRLGHHDVLLLFTDGVVELRGADGRFGDAGDRALLEVLEEHAGRPAAQVASAVERRAVELQRGEPRDDIAVVAVRPCP